MVKLSEILGLNARTQLYSYRYNKPGSRDVADSKLATKRVLKKFDIPIPKVYGKFRNPSDIFKFNWDNLPDSFALKPNKGMGGEGIIIVKKKAKLPEKGWISTQKKLVTIEDLKLHVMDILEGAYSIDNSPDIAYIEEYVGRHKAFRKYAFRGTPDIRVIVFNRVPMMSMLRLPTKESGGRANLHQGAIAVGVDIATGITMRAYWHGNYILYKPGTKRKLHGIKIPHWTDILTIAVKCQEATRIGYLGVDVVLHPEKGPMVLELNCQPGLSIQLANLSGLKRRLSRIEDLDVRDAEHGVKIAKALFGSSFSDKVISKEGLRIVKPIENVRIYHFASKKYVNVKARVDTGAVRSSIDKNLAEHLGLLVEENVLWRRKYAYRSAQGKESRPVIGLTFRLMGKKIKTSASIADRSKLTTPLLIARDDLVGFLVNPLENGEN